MTQPASTHDEEPDPTTMHRGCGTFGLAGVALLLLVGAVQTYRFAQYPRTSPPAHLILARNLVEQAVQLHLRRSQALPARQLPPQLEDYGQAFPRLTFSPKLPTDWSEKLTLIEASFHPGLGGGGLQLRWGIPGERPLSLFLIPLQPGLEKLDPLTLVRAGLQVKLQPGSGQLELRVEIP